jgi:hypothetical protein
MIEIAAMARISHSERREESRLNRTGRSFREVELRCLAEPVLSQSKGSA